jgi:CubicO group peptidase (beta-lactamase class C family)
MSKPSFVPPMLTRRSPGLVGVCLVFLFSLILSAQESLDKVTVRGKLGTQIDEYLSRAVPFGFSGTVLVADADGVLLHKGYGMADVRHRRPNGITTIFDMGSITKALTATAILGLEAEGKLRVDDRISKYFDVPADKQDITLHQLLTHTSGLVSDVGGDYDDIPKAKALEMAFAAPLVAPPGTEFHYSNVGFSLLAALIEKLTGEAYETHMRRKFFLPSAMRSTGYRALRFDEHKVAHNYQQGIDLGTPTERLIKANGPNWDLIGNGGMLTTAADLYRWEVAYRKGLFIPAEPRAKQFAPQFRRNANLSQGYDWWIEKVDWDPSMVYHRGGDSPGYALNAEYRRYPDSNITIILLANNRLKGWSSRRYIVPNIRRILLGQKLNLPPQVRAARIKLPRFEAHTEPDVGFSVEPQGAHLRLLATGQTATDALTFNRVPTSLATRRRMNVRAEEFVTALQSGDPQKLAPFVDPGQAGSILSEWKQEVEKRKGLSRVELLGTGRVDRGQFLTTIRLHFHDQRDPVVTVRFCWASDRVNPNSDDYTFPPFTSVMHASPIDAAVEDRFWPTEKPGEFVTHDLLTGEDLRMTVKEGSIVFDLPGGPLKVQRRP